MTPVADLLERRARVSHRIPMPGHLDELVVVHRVAEGNELDELAQRDAREYLPAQDLAAEHHLRTIRGDEIHIVQDGIEEREKRVEAPAAFDAKFTPVPARDAWRTKTVAGPLIPRLPHGNCGSATHLARIVASAAPHAGCTGHRPLNCCAIVTNSSTAGDVTGGSAIPNSK